MTDTPTKETANPSEPQNKEALQKTAPSWLNPLCEYGPLGVFFVTYLLGDLFQATAAVMIATVISLGVSYAITRTWPKVPTITAPILLVMGGLTLYLEDETFIKVRPTLVNAFFCIALFISVAMKKSPLKFLAGHALDMVEEGWRILTIRFAVFFGFLAIVNEIVWRTQSNDFWVTYKVFGAMGLTFAFMLSQTPMIGRYMREKKKQNVDGDTPKDA